MTAAELATAMATQGAAEHRAEGERETIPDYWTGSLLTGLDFKADSRFGWTEPGDCEQRSPDESLGCTRNLNHPGRHIATGGDHVMAAWPGTHEPTLADLDDPQPAAEQPQVLTLPAGWERVDKKDGTLSYCVRSNERLPDIYADAEDDGVEWDGSGGATTEDARTFAARLVEAVGIVEQLRAGAR